MDKVKQWKPGQLVTIKEINVYHRGWSLSGIRVINRICKVKKLPVYVKDRLGSTHPEVVYDEYYFFNYNKLPKNCYLEPIRWG